MSSLPILPHSNMALFKRGSMRRDLKDEEVSGLGKNANLFQALVVGFPRDFAVIDAVGADAGGS